MAVCEKQCYVTMERADEVAEERSRASGENIRAYKCPHCGWPHLTNKTKKKAKGSYWKRKRRLK